NAYAVVALNDDRKFCRRQRTIHCGHNNIKLLTRVYLRQRNCVRRTEGCDYISLGCRRLSCSGKCPCDQYKKPKHRSTPIELACPFIKCKHTRYLLLFREMA